MRNKIRFLKSKGNRKRSIQILPKILALLLVACVVMQGLNVTDVRAETETIRYPKCGITAHTHIDKFCGQYNCGQSWTPGHVHTDACLPFNTWGDHQAHTHDESCYTTTTVDTIETEDPSSTIVNVFDYWVTDNREDPDYSRTWDNNIGDITKGKDNQNGINYLNGTRHNLRFRVADGDERVNQYKSSDLGKPVQGMVDSKLSSGYPLLKTNSDLGITYDESLAYLFDPNYQGQNGRKVFTNVKGLFKTGTDGPEKGYHVYNSQDNYAYLNEINNDDGSSTGNFTVYNRKAILSSASGAPAGQFFPFNTLGDALGVDLVGDSASSSEVLNHYFGLTMTTRFTQDYGGYTSPSNTQATTFEFSGDDDVWIYIDDVLVGDLGGIHQASNIIIDFSTGQVKVSYTSSATGLEVPVQETTLKALYDDAGMSGVTTWSGDTYEDDTTHTLKFFYLERGNYDSNLSLKFNMQDVPATSIKKVDQYGDARSGATFGVYAAVKDTTPSSSSTDASSHVHYSYVVDPKEGDTGTVTVSAEEVDKNGTIGDDGVIHIKINGADRTITPKKTVTTDEKGEAILLNEDGMTLGVDELKKLFGGDQFILRELVVPKGYRTVSDTICMYFTGTVLQCADPYSSGVWASNNALVTASDEIYSAADGHPILTNDVTTNGTLFAVVLKRNDKGLNDISNWYPVYGSDDDGYFVLSSEDYKSEEMTADQAQNAAILEAAKLSQKYGSTVFTQKSGGFQATLTNLPGLISRYYTYMQNNDQLKDATNTDPQYIVAYYWTPAASLEAATVDNITRVVSHSDIVDDYDGFDIKWGSTIEIPDMENRLYVQKRDTNQNPVSGAVFALYQVDEDNEGTVYYYTGDGSNGIRFYLTNDTDQSIPFVNKGKVVLKGSVEATGTFAINGEGVISIIAENGATYSINPVQLSKSVDLTDVDYTGVYSEGLMCFKELTNGYYLVREVAVPDGYLLNQTETKVLVNDDGVFANAGTATDGVDVGNGVGYLTKTLDVFASEGSIDETLTWIYSTLRVNKNEGQQSFSSFSLGNEVKYAVKQEGDKVGYGGGDPVAGRSNAMVTYLVFDREADNTLFDYRACLTQGARTNPKDGEEGPVVLKYEDSNKVIHEVPLEKVNVETQTGEGTLALYTDEGWTALEVYQDYAFGSGQTSSTTYYEDLQDRNISNLFSNSTFVLYEDEMVADLTITKEGEGKDGAQNNPLDDATFELTNSKGQTYYVDQTTVGETTTYSYGFADSSTSAAEGTTRSYTVTTDSNGQLTFHGLREGVYTLHEVNSGSPDHTVISDSIITVKPVKTSIQSDVSSGDDGESDNGDSSGGSAEEDGSDGETTDEVNPEEQTSTIIHVAMTGGWNPKFIGYQYCSESGMTVFSYAVTIVDPLKSETTPVSLVKLDEDETTPLQNASFILYKKTEDESQTKQYYVETTSDGKVKASWSTTDSDKKVKSSDESGLLTFYDLEPGTYYLMETVAPKGHLLDETEKSFQVVRNEENNTYSIVNVSGSNLSLDNESSVLQLKMTNQRDSVVYELPNSGGSGTLYFYLFGCLLMGLSLFLYAQFLQTEDK